MRIEGDAVTHDSVRAEVDRIVAENVLGDVEVRRRIAALLPQYRLSKIQQALHDAYGVDVVARYLLDAGGTGAWLTNMTAG